MAIGTDGFPLYRHARLIGFGHKARQGKDLAAHLLRVAFPGRVERIAFADAVRVLARVQHGMTVKDAPLLQRVGVSARETDPDIWIRVVAWSIAELDAAAAEPFLVAIPDTRFPNEAAFVEARGVSCELVRYGVDGQRVVADDRPADHVSEVALNGHLFSHIIHHSNASGGIDWLRRRVTGIGADLLAADPTENRPRLSVTA